MITGETALSSMLSLASFSASSICSRLRLPAPRLTPPELLEPGVITTMLTPRSRMLCSMRDWAPWPMATMQITAPTPMMMPSMVSMLRILVRSMLRKAMRISFSGFMMSPQAAAAAAEIAPGAAPVRTGSSRTIRPSRSSTMRLRIPGDVRFVGDHDDGQALVVELLEQGQDLDAGARVQVAGGLVGQQQRGLGDQGAGDGDPLLLTARELVGLVVAAVAQAHALERLPGRGGGIEPAARAVVEQGQLDVLLGAGAGQQIESLEDEADVSVADVGQPVAAEAVDALAVQFVGARGRPVQAAEDVHERRLSRSRSAHDGDHLAVR